VEVYNDTQAAVDFSKYKFFEANVNHAITALSEKNLEAGEYGVVIQDSAKFFADYPNFTGKAFTSSFSLSNTGEVLAFKNSSGATVDSYTYAPSVTGAGNGLSEQLVSGSWIKGAASPGQENVAVVIVEPPVTSTTTTTTSATSTVTTATVTEIVEVPKIVYVQKAYWPATEKIYVNAGENKLTVTGAEVQFEGRVYDVESKRQLTTGDFHWSFGDGYESFGSRAAKHIYKFPGEYTAIFQASSFEKFEEDRLYVKVVNPEISLKMGREGDLNFIEIANNYEEELKLDNFMLSQLDQNGLALRYFTLPKGFSVLPKRAVKIDMQVTKFVAPVFAVGLNYSAELQLAKATNPNYGKLLNPQTVTSSSDLVQVYLPEQVPASTTSVETKISTPTAPLSIQPTSTQVKKKVVYTNLSKNTVKTSTSATLPATSTTQTSSTSKTIISKPSESLWSKVKTILGLQP
jgi:hypothetical protein